jgi:hypothetical protein
MCVGGGFICDTLRSNSNISIETIEAGALLYDRQVLLFAMDAI